MSELPLIAFVVMPLAAYAVGSTPFGVILARARGVDLRKTGSGNVGATNVGRVLGRKWGYLCFALDVAKGALPTALAGWMLRGQADAPALAAQVAWLLVGMGAILGHVFSFWLTFRGGKGVATALGAVLGFYPYFTAAGLVALALWIVVTLASRYVSLGSIVAAVAFLPLFAAFNWSHAGQLWPFGAFAATMAALIILRHRGNIRRLLNGTENKIRRGPRQADAGA
ncbi:MAG: glycerol-3-phosphate 1-O-acyltransferase PlsY [Phycisphaerae bacterium]|jgi:glycerol-3-phosphate acyltransferase PlsY